MQYSDLTPQWQDCFGLAVKAFKRGSLPIGCVVYDASGRVISRARARMIYGSPRTNMTQHAEIEALKRIPIPALEQRLTLYSTVEPCPMCFGAINVARIAELHYATRDPWAGSTGLLDGNWYMQRKHIEVHRAGEEFERIMACFLVYAMMKKKKERGFCDLKNEFVERWKKLVPDIVPVLMDLLDVKLEGFSRAADIFNAISETVKGNFYA